MINPGVSSIGCKENYAVTGLKRSTNCDTVVGIGEGNAVKIKSSTTGLARPGASAISCSDDCSVFTDGCSGIGVRKRNSKKDSASL
jgi:hypothetical protein